MTRTSRPLSSAAVRGLLLGMALGDAYERARGTWPRRGPIEIGVSTQLAAFTAEGLVRVLTSHDEVSARRTAEALWDATARWGVGQGLLAGDQYSWSPIPNGWLSEVSPLSDRRGSAPATVAALQGGHPGTLDEPLNAGASGTTAVLRTLPTAVLCSRLTYSGPYSSADQDFARFAALTHGSGETIHASVATAAVAYHCLRGRTVSDAVAESGMAEMGSLLGGARDIGEGQPRHKGALRQWLRNDALSAMAGGVYTAISFPDPYDAPDALDFAYQLPNARGAAAIALALHGAVHGVHSLPVDLVNRLEVGWALDTLGADLAQALTGTVTAPDRYPQLS